MKRVGLFVGVDRYERLPELAGAVEDARGMREFFRGRAGYEATEVLENPGYPGEVAERIRAAREGLEAGDLLVVYFAGHGVVWEGAPRLLCAKAHPDAVHRDSDVLKLQDIADAARGEQDTVVVIDACQSDIVREGQDAVDLVAELKAKLAEKRKLEEGWAKLAEQGIVLRGLFGGLFRKRDLSLCGTDGAGTGEVAPVAGRGRRGLYAVLFSCQGGEASAEYEGHGLFTRALLEELNEAADGGLSVKVGDPLRVRVDGRMERLLKERGLGAEQHAQIHPAIRPVEIVAGRADKRDEAAPAAKAEGRALEGRAFTCGTGGIPMRWCMGTACGEWKKEHGTDWFRMGAQADEDGANCFVPCDGRAAETGHRVRLTRGFWIGETEVTQKQWREVMGTTVAELCAAALADGTEYEYADTAYPDEPERMTFRERRGGRSPQELCYNTAGDAPVYFASWEDAMAFCRRLTEREGEAGRLPKGYEYRLPTEAEWEFACRAGSEATLPTGEPFRIAPVRRGGSATFVGSMDAVALEEIAWYGGNSSVGWDGRGPDTDNWERHGKRKRHPGGRAAQRSVYGKRANAWGIRDMLGNVWEWCLDWFDRYPAGGGVDSDPFQARRPGGLAGRVVRGGCWYSDAQECRPAARWRHEPGFRQWTVGFRVALAPIVKEEGM